jgi:mannose-6-phosphate isomerase-like protein (cupin superfamily)
MAATTLAIPLEVDQLADLVREVARDLSSWQPRVCFRRDERWWTRLSGDETVDVWLLTWVQDTGTDLHDHGDSAAAFTVVSGILDEVRPDGSGGLATTRLRAGQVRTVEPGAVHDVRNPHLRAAISIHAYSPPLREMTFYNHTATGPEPTRTVLTNGEPEVDAP